MARRSRSFLACCVVAAVTLGAAAGSAVPTGPVRLEVWRTTGDRSELFHRSADVAWHASAAAPQGMVVEVDPTRVYQPVDGFGGAMTGSSAWVLDHDLSASARDALLTSFYGASSGLGMTMVRVPLGPSDFSPAGPGTYDDTRGSLADFSLGTDLTTTVPLLRRAAQLSPSLKVVGSPWSAPAWMKTSGSVAGGTLAGSSYAVYAQYLVKAAQAWAAQGLPLYAMTVQNEPLLDTPAYPSMTLTPGQEAAFVGYSLGPRMAAAGLGTKIVVFDHNWDTPSYPLAVLADPAARRYAAGTAFHCYGGSPARQTVVHDAYPALPVWTTECSGGTWGAGFAGDLVWASANTFVGSLRAWSRGVLWFNLALDTSGGPTSGGCSGCRGLVTVDPATGTWTKNPEYYVMAHFARFVRPGAHRVASSTASGQVDTVAFVNTDGSTVLELVNEGGAPRAVTVRYRGRDAVVTLPARSLVTLRWAG
ncbi:glycoside hydrolase family 30 protein [Luteimicrobium subarcticum]|uniref:Glucosylceramidase n=1 Tax=Luteimicrobium subarcticum TaxID=620910 RepID=A0A2M8WSN1_9MICO|nr:glycoside hydrolase family 30 beta sandwich domain-containing protein [Luteimicrobium subarcticum]PJI93894.1 glucosylceramidase [Luteimicrobium subarcticum]